MITYNRSFASHPQSKYWSCINNKNPTDVYKSTGDKYWFECNICNHKFNISLYNVSCSNQWCPYCSNAQLCATEDCIICFNKSFASHEKSKYLSNKNINPRNIFKYSNKSFIFNCNTCDHTFEAIIHNISLNQWCPYCAFPCKKLCNDNECNICFNHSFYSNYNSLFWSSINEEHPRDVIKSSKYKYWFDCHECNHCFEISLDNIINNKWCPYCSHTKLCNDELCNICFNNSFKSIDNSKYIVDATINPRNIFKYKKYKITFNCNICYNNFEASVHHVSNGSWCSLCRLKTESILYKWLSYHYSIVKIHNQYEWCTNNDTGKSFIYDFEINNKIIVELDGAQHFKQVSNWLSPEIQRKRDMYKIKCALENNKHIIHIYQEDVYNNRNNWENKLKKTIDTLLLIQLPQLQVIGISKTHFN